MLKRLGAIGATIGAGLIAGAAVALWSLDGFAAEKPQTQGPTAYDIVRFDCEGDSATGDIITLTLEIKIRGSADPTAEATVAGRQSGATVYEESFSLVSESRDGGLESTLFYTATSPGLIAWRAATPNDEAACATQVADSGGGRGDSHDDDDGGSGTTDSSNIVASHDSGSPQFDEHCLDCHGDVLSEQSLDPAIPGPHVAMRTKIPGEDNETKCTWCHRTVDLVQGTQSQEKSDGDLRKRVDVRLCTLCHGPQRSAAQFYRAGLSQTEPDGALLYELACATCHRSLENSEVRGESADEIREEIDEDEGGMGPLRVLTAQEILAISDALAR
jgi:hypothetical protein